MRHLQSKISIIKIQNIRASKSNQKIKNFLRRSSCRINITNCLQWKYLRSVSKKDVLQCKETNIVTSC